MNRYAASAVLPFLGANLLFAVTAQAQDVQCPPGLGQVNIDGTVLVSGACRLDGTRVDGNVQIFPGGSLVASDVHIGGSIQADSADFIDVRDSRVDGNIQLAQMVGDDIVVFDSRIGGSIQLDDNRSRLEIDGNDVSGNIQAFGNSGGTVIAGNRIEGSLQCQRNQPPPVGGNNQVGGDAQDQCADLRVTSGNGGSAPATGGSGPAPGDAGSGGGGSLSLPGAALLLLLAVGRVLTRRRGQRAIHRQPRH